MKVMTSLAAVGALWGTVFWLTIAADNIAENQSRQVIQSELEAASADLSAIIRHTGRWDSAYDWVTNRNTEQVVTNIGSGASERGPFNFIYIMSSVGTPIYAFEEGIQRQGALAYNIELVNVARAALREVPFEPYQTVSGYFPSQGRIAMATVGRIQTVSGLGQTAQTAPILIGARWFDQSDLDEMGNRLRLEGLRLDFWDAEPREGTTSAPLLDIAGRPIAHVSWYPPRPGDTLMEAATPVIVALSLAMITASVIVGRVAMRQTNALAEQMQLARTDSMTGLMNRNGLEQALTTPAIKDAFERGEVATIYFDLNKFKPLNDELGHAAGDIALQVVAERLVACFRSRDFVARVGGDEFLALVIDPDPDTAAQKVVARLVELMEEPIGRGVSRVLSISYGIALSRNGKNWEDIVRAADQKMYAHKTSGKRSNAANSAA